MCLYFLCRNRLHAAQRKCLFVFKMIVIFYCEDHVATVRIMCLLLDMHVSFEMHLWVSIEIHFCVSIEIELFELKIKYIVNFGILN